MRLDLFLKSGRLVKRRAVAREMCDSGRVAVNDHDAKPGRDVKPGDKITLRFSSRTLELEVLAVPAARSHTRPPQELFRLTSDRRTNGDPE